MYTSRNVSAVSNARNRAHFGEAPCDPLRPCVGPHKNGPSASLYGPISPSEPDRSSSKIASHAARAMATTPPPPPPWKRRRRPTPAQLRLQLHSPSKDTHTKTLDYYGLKIRQRRTDKGTDERADSFKDETTYLKLE